MATIPFTNNYADLSTPRGFQFKFHCRKCGNGYMSTFQSNTLGAAASVAQSVSGLLGGLFSRAAQSAEQLQQIRWAAGSLQSGGGDLSRVRRQESGREVLS
jgi:hypothetical protein